MTSSSRFIVIDQSETAHCCFEATVVDTAEAKDGSRGRNVCECLDAADAERIAAVLNAAEAAKAA